MTIVFEAYTGHDGAGNVALPFAARGTNRTGNYGVGQMPFGTSGAGTLEGHGQGNALLPFLTFATDAASYGRATLPFSASGYNSEVAPPSFGIGATAIPLGLSGYGRTIALGNGSTTLALSLFGTDVASFGHATLPFGAYGSEVAPSRFASLYQLPWVEANGFTGTLLELSDDFIAADHHDADFIQALMDLILFSDGYSRAAEVLQALADGVALADVAQMIIAADLLDSFIASVVQEGTAQLTVMLADGFDVADGASALSEILAALHDGFYATLTINNGEDTYTAWVMTPKTKAMRSYSNWNFNSYAVIGGQFLAAGPAGIYRMGGTTDAGEVIRTAIRTGKMNFGSTAMKGAPVVYVGAITSGTLLLRVQATTIRGEDLEQTYRLTPAVTGAPREHRFQVGRGFRSVYWTFELANDVDGATAEVHEWHVVPVTHTGKPI